MFLFWPLLTKLFPTVDIIGLSEIALLNNIFGDIVIGGWLSLFLVIEKLFIKSFVVGGKIEELSQVGSGVYEFPYPFDKGISFYKEPVPDIGINEILGVRVNNLEHQFPFKLFLQQLLAILRDLLFRVD